MPALRHVDSIIEDEEEGHVQTANSASFKSFPSSPVSQKFPGTPNSHSFDLNNRVRSMSTSQVLQAPSKLLRKSSWNASNMDHQTPQNPTPSPKHLEGKPVRTRKTQRNIENVDLDDIMNGSDEEDETQSSLPPSSYRGLTKATGPASGKVSRSAQELIDFLAEGPPPDPQTSFSAVPPSPGFSKSKPGRLGWMMSKLTGTPSIERLREESGSRMTHPAPLSPSTRGTYGQQPTFQSSLPTASKYPGVIIGTPPRPPRPVESIVPVSPPATPNSPTREDFSTEDRRSPQPAKVVATRKAVPPFEAMRGEAAMLAPPPRQPSRGSPFSQSKESLHSTSSVGHVLVNGRLNGSGVNRDTSLSGQSRTDNEDVAANGGGVRKLEERKPVPTPLLTLGRVDELRRLMSSATNADECRVLTDMFLARIGFPIKRVGEEQPYPSPVSDPEDTKMESSLVEILLGGSSSSSESCASTEEEAQSTYSSIPPVVPPVRNASRNASLQNIQDTQLYQPQRTLTVV
jgi:hypothetical protein